ncbi:RagB/SusD family nutrient uptake outer membrane protein [Balneolaceae bacterium YR4-1]|uniref:RagB/SusD family nutrient uptake outer membrane protein n=1 Tax=Halalkalibaculum roseum TaxID=2709311 RepID=A0A6M1SRG8_9BACT|nr:RagB/SusD family nutrient uptake outer membrane protein [Halalkalibaculum roseum]NGP77689.1 RagB/SusD family nutrient uptake outer membrane protein [Halalkalibaculum roseum]
MNFSKNIYLKHTALLIVLVVFVSGCDIFKIQDRPDPNNTELGTVINNPTRSEVNTLVTGTESGLRTDLRIYHINTGMIGREMYRFLAAEPRNTGDLLGKGNSELDAGSFYTTRPWAAFYTNIRNANILIQSVNTIQGDALSDAEKNGVYGFANTIKGYQYLMALTMQNENGIRLQNETDLQQTGAVLSKDDAYAEIAALLDDAATDLQNAGAAFSFSLSSGFAGFDTPPGFLQFNRALRARVAAYRGNFDTVLSALDDSFIDETADLGLGVYHVYSTATNDQLNPVFADPNAGSGDSWVAHPSWVADAEAGDERVDNKVVLRDEEASLDGLSSNYGLFVYQSQTAPFPMIRNAELILLRAEALAQRNNAGDLDDAEDDINVIRDAAGLSDFDRGLGGQDAVIDEMLRQRRYELFFEGHRWIDMRRYDRLDQLPIDRAGDNVWESFPIPENENV